MSYTIIDQQITHWAERNALKFLTTSGERECRAAYVSSKAGECFQIYIEAPQEGQVSVRAAGIESRRDDEPPEEWRVPITTQTATAN